MRARDCKIVATMGPASDAPERLAMLIQAGVDCFRLNFSHGAREDHARRMAAIRAAEEKAGTPVGVFADLQGPKIRVGMFENGEIKLKFNDIVTIEASTEPGAHNLIRLPHPELVNALEVGDILKLDDGKLQLTVTERGRTQLKARVDFGGVLPVRLAAMTAAEVARVEVRHGNRMLALGELFDVAALGGADESSTELRLEGDLSRFDAIGQGLDGGVLRIDGAVGDRLGLAMRGGEIHVNGAAGLLAGCEMAGGLIDIAGDVGDFAAGALPGSMDGMRGGTLIVRGNAGARCGDRMRRGTVVVHGDAGDFLASRMVAGTIAVAGRVGAHCGYGMRRGTLVFAGPPPAVPPTFVATHQDIVVFWTLLRRSLAYHGGPFAALPPGAPRRLVGDLAAGGKGEWLF